MSVVIRLDKDTFKEISRRTRIIRDDMATYLIDAERQGVVWYFLISPYSWRTTQVSKEALLANPGLESEIMDPAEWARQDTPLMTDLDLDGPSPIYAIKDEVAVYLNDIEDPPHDRHQ